MPESPSSYHAAAIRVCVDTLDPIRRVATGRLLNQWIPRPLEFSDLGQLLLQAERILDIQGFPQAYQRKRSFSVPSGNPSEKADESEQGIDPAVVEAAHGMVRTFSIIVETRMNTTWQGLINWLDVTPMVHFDSALELIRIADEALFAE